MFIQRVIIYIIKMSDDNNIYVLLMLESRCVVKENIDRSKKDDDKDDDQ